MALAISDDFAALCCFRPLPELLAAFSATPELALLVGPQPVAALRAADTPEAGKLVRAVSCCCRSCKQACILMLDKAHVSPFCRRRCVRPSLAS